MTATRRSPWQTARATALAAIAASCCLSLVACERRPSTRAPASPKRAPAGSASVATKPLRPRTGSGTSSAAASRAPRARRNRVHRARGEPPHETPYSCAGAAQRADAPRCKATDAVLLPLIRLGARFGHDCHADRANCPDKSRFVERALRLARAVLALGRARLRKLSLSERLVAQHAAFYSAIRIDWLVRGKARAAAPVKPTRRALARVVAKLALSAKQLRALGAQPMPGARAWLGPPARWVELREHHKPMRHEHEARFTLAFRPIHGGKRGTTRALFGQFLAVDRRWRPHVTPLVQRMELRLGKTRAAPACVVEIDLSRLACGARAVASLRAIPTAAKLPKLPLLANRAGKVFCNACHMMPARFRPGVTRRPDGSADNPYDLVPLTARERVRWLRARDKRLLGKLRPLLAKLRALAASR